MNAESCASHAKLIAWLCPVIARACHRDSTSVCADSRLLELGLDSLTLVSVLTQIEAAHDLELTSEETLTLIEAADVRALARALVGIIAGRCIGAQ